MILKQKIPESGGIWNQMITGPFQLLCPMTPSVCFDACNVGIVFLPFIPPCSSLCFPSCISDAVFHPRGRIGVFLLGTIYGEEPLVPPILLDSQMLKKMVIVSMAMWITELNADKKKLLSPGKKVEKFKAETTQSKSWSDPTPPQSTEKGKQEHSLLISAHTTSGQGSYFIFFHPHSHRSPGFSLTGSESLQCRSGLSL